MGIKVHLLDGTYELFRHHYGRPSHTTAAGREVGATRGVLASVLALLDEGATHVGVATDHVIESFRNDLWPTYKSSAGMPEELLGQFGLLEDALQAMGVAVFAMVEREADDALASAAVTAAADPGVDQVVICTPDKDLAQCVAGDRVVVLDRRSGTVLDDKGVQGKYGVPPESIPDWLALVGDSADGYPGLPGWGAVSAAAVLRRYRHLEDIPTFPGRWDVAGLRGVPRLCSALAEHRDEAFLFRDLATLRPDPPVLERVGDLRWTGPTDAFPALAAGIDGANLARKAAASAAGR